MKICSKQYKKEYRAKNKEMLSIKRKQYYADNKERSNELSKQHYKDNTARMLASMGKDQAVARGAVLPDNYTLDSCVPFYEEARRLTQETGIQHHVDNIIPCTVGGLHCPTNLQVLTAQANMAKSNHITGE